MADRLNEKPLLDWIQSKSIPASRVLEVAEVEADPDYAEQAFSISLQLDFPDLKQAREWLGLNMPQLRTDLMAKFGESAMTFATILKEHTDAG